MESGKVINSTRFISYNTPINNKIHKDLASSSDIDIKFLITIKQLINTYNKIDLSILLTNLVLTDFHLYWLILLASTHNESITFISYVFNNYKINTDLLDYYKTKLNNILSTIISTTDLQSSTDLQSTT